MTDTPLLARFDLPPLALKWTGHGASDEIGAMLAVSRARDFAGFRAAFERFAVPGQNMLYADAEGNIGQVDGGAWLPARSGRPMTFSSTGKRTTPPGGRCAAAADLPYSLNPEPGFLVSANNRPPETDIPVGFFFSPDDRVRRMTALIGGEANGGCRGPEGAAAGRVHVVLGERCAISSSPGWTIWG